MKLNKKWAASRFLALICIFIFTGVLFFILTVTLDNTTILSNSGVTIVSALLSVATATAILFIFFKSDKENFFDYHEDVTTPYSILSAHISSLNYQKFIAAFACLSFGITAIYFTAQGIYEVQNTELRINYTTNADTIQSIDKNIEKLVNDIASTSVDDTIKLAQNKLEILRAERTLIEEREESARSRNADSKITGAFLFSFFSSLFVRLGTIGIVMILFGVCLNQFRRIDSRINELKLILAAMKLVGESPEIGDLKAIRDTLLINDEPKKITATSAELAFSRQATQLEERLLDKIPSLLEKLLPPAK